MRVHPGLSVLLIAAVIAGLAPPAGAKLWSKRTVSETRIPTRSNCPARQLRKDPTGSFMSFPLYEPLREPLQVYVEVDNNNDAYKSRYVMMVKEAMQEWSNALGGRLVYVMVRTPANAHIKVYWREDLGERMGETRPWFNKARIDIVGNRFNDPASKATILHELGHALGLKHSPNSQDVMYYQGRLFEPSTRYKLTPNDIRAIQCLYDCHCMWEDPYRAE